MKDYDLRKILLEDEIEKEKQNNAEEAYINSLLED